MAATAEAPAVMPPVSVASDPLSVGCWAKVDGGGEEASSQQPCQRSLHVAAVLNDCLYIFGGYDGSNR